MKACPEHSRRVLITGATGFLGSEIARQAVAAGHTVRVTVRRSSKLDGLRDTPVEKVEADILDKASILRALDGCDAVIHTAANVSPRLRDTAAIFKANVEGTRNVLEAALERKVARAVYTSSIATINVSDEPILHDERTTWTTDRLGSPYVTAKKRAEELVQDLAKRGLPVVILNPGMILGPGDVYGGSTRLVSELLSGKIAASIEGGISFCDVREVAAAHVAALEGRGAPGERYIVAGQNFTYGELFETATRLAGKKKPRRAPYALAYAIAFASEVAARFFEHKYEDINRPVIRHGGRYNYCEVAKAAKELGYTVRPFEETVRDTIVDHVRRGVVAAETPQLVALKAAPSSSSTASEKQVPAGAAA